ncbi:hypothetical protein HQ563_13550 [bacterium]|nr:hypothetical protein [bacterium]
MTATVCAASKWLPGGRLDICRNVGHIGAVWIEGDVTGIVLLPAIESPTAKGDLEIVPTCSVPGGPILTRRAS